MTMNRLIIFAIYFFASLSINAQQESITNFQNTNPEASISFCLKDVSTGNIDFQYNAEKSLAPASIQKLATTITAFDKFGANDKYKTTIGYTGEIIKGVLQGSLVIKASGDPTWNSKYFPENNIYNEIKEILRLNEIKKISWGVIIDEGDIDSSVPNTWIWEDIANYFGASSHAINIYDNTYNIKFFSRETGALTSIDTIIPPIEDITFDNKVLASDDNRDNAWIYGGPNSTVRIIKGTIPKFSKNFIVKGSISNTNKVFLSELILYLKKYGIECKYKLLTRHIDTFDKLDIVKSPKLSEIIYHTNQKSVNLYAESLSKKVGNIEEYWNDKGFNMRGVKMYDGCGASRFNMLTSSFITDLLVYGHKQKYSKYLLHSLPKAGESGTLKRFGKGTCLVGNLQAKTGSMKGVRAYAGYITVDSKLKAFSIIVNNYSCEDKEIEKGIEKVLISICK